MTKNERYSEQSKIIVIGDIIEPSFVQTPIKVFKKAYDLSKQEEWVVFTNNPQFVEVLEVLNDDVKIYLRLNGREEEIDVIEAYDFLGDVYDIIRRIKIKKDLDEDVTDKWIEHQIKEYNMRYMELIGDEKILKIKRLNSTEPINYAEWVKLHQEVGGDMNE